MTVQEFHLLRKPFYLDSDTLLIKFPTSKHLNENHAKWFSDEGIPYLHTVRGYYVENTETPYIMIYWNDFEIPNVNAALFTYLFEYFPKIKWIGLGCNKGELGEIWKPKLTIYKDKFIGNDNTSDGYHTFGELYRYRKLYNAAFFNELAKNNNIHKVVKSKKHSDGEDCFGGGWFIVSAELPTGQISNHYELKDWDLFDCPEVDKAPEWDGHTPEDVANRIEQFIIDYQKEF